MIHPLELSAPQDSITSSANVYCQPGEGYDHHSLYPNTIEEKSNHFLKELKKQVLIREKRMQYCYSFRKLQQLRSFYIKGKSMPSWERHGKTLKTIYNYFFNLPGAVFIGQHQIINTRRKC